MAEAMHEQYTRCPGCASIFRVGPAQRSAAADRVRCGLCGEYFVAGEHMLPSAQVRGLLARASAAGQAAMSDPPDPVAPEDAGGERREASSGAAVDADDRDPAVPAADAATANPVPESTVPASAAIRERPDLPAGGDWGEATRLAVESDAQGARRPRWRGLALSLALLLGLLAQVAWLSWERILEVPALRPLAVQWCVIAGCEVPIPRAPELVEVLDRTLRPHPEIDDTLLLTATLVNRGSEPQPWPDLGLVLTALNGDVVAREWFPAAVYYHAFEPRPELMPPGRAVRARLAFREPDREAVGFELRFR